MVLALTSRAKPIVTHQKGRACVSVASTFGKIRPKTEVIRSKTKIREVGLSQYGTNSFVLRLFEELVEKKRQEKPH